MTAAQLAQVRHLNYVARTAMGIGSVLVVTPGFNALALADQSAIREKVERFDAFTPANDPHQENDFGAVEHNGTRCFWKIDYYDAAMENGSEEPWNRAMTRRVLTIMLAEEY